MRHVMILTTAAVMLILFTTVFAANSTIIKTIENIHLEKAQYSGKQVSLRGKVVKVNNGIMKRNFIHIQDGSGAGDTSKLIVTSQQTAKVGDEVVATGTVVLDTDFSMGYQYDILIEKATLTPAK